MPRPSTGETFPHSHNAPVNSNYVIVMLIDVLESKLKKEGVLVLVSALVLRADARKPLS